MSPVAEDKIERKFGSTYRLCHFFGHSLQNLLLLIRYFHFYPDQNNVNEKWYYLATTNLTVFDNLLVPTVQLKDVNEKWYYLATTNLTVFDNLLVPTVQLKAGMMSQSIHNDVTWSWWKGSLTKSNQFGLFIIIYFYFILFSALTDFLCDYFY